MKATNLRNYDAPIILADHQPSADTAAIITIPAATDVVHVLESLQWSYSEVPASANLLVTIGGTTVFSVDIVAGGPGDTWFPKGLHGLANKEMVITLAAGGGTASGKINAQYR